MSLNSELELRTTREKLRLLEERFEAAKLEECDEHVRELSQLSLKKWINRLKEEIIRYEIRERAKST